MPARADYPRGGRQSCYLLVRTCELRAGIDHQSIEWNMEYGSGIACNQRRPVIHHQRYPRPWAILSVEKMRARKARRRGMLIGTRECCPEQEEKFAQDF